MSLVYDMWYAFWLFLVVAVSLRGCCDGRDSGWFVAYVCCLSVCYAVVVFKLVNSVDCFELC